MRAGVRLLEENAVKMALYVTWYDPWAVVLQRAPQVRSGVEWTTVTRLCQAQMRCQQILMHRSLENMDCGYREARPCRKRQGSVPADSGCAFGETSASQYLSY